MAPGINDDQRQALVYVMSALGAIKDDCVVVGGMVPGLLGFAMDGDEYPPLATGDVDLGFNIAIATEGKCEAMQGALATSGFKREDLSGKPFRWTCRNQGLNPVYIDFLAPDVPTEAYGDFNPTSSFFLTEGLQLAFVDKIGVELVGNIQGTRVSVVANVCGPGAFIVLKALAFECRRIRKDSESLKRSQKDAYDLICVLRNFGKGPQDVAQHMALLGSDPAVIKAGRILKANFLNENNIGPRSVSLRREGGLNAGIQADATSLVVDLFKALGWPIPKSD